jgi:undecaprenyl-diphosphatase
MLETLIDWDKKLLLLFNGIHNSFWDSFMFFISRKEVWIPFYIVLIYLIYRSFKSRTVLIVIAIALVVTLSDQIASSVFKPYFKRFRPCHDAEIGAQVHTVNGCGGKYFWRCYFPVIIILQKEPELSISISLGSNNFI